MPFDGIEFKQQNAVLDLLWRARERIARPGGWCQGDYSIGDGVCIFGAFNYVTRNNLYAMPGQGVDVKNLSTALEQGVAALACILGTSELDIYNDAPGRTQAEIVELFDCAIVMKEGKIE